MNKTAVASLTAYADNAETALNKYFEAAGRYMIFPDIHHDATALVWNPFEVVSSAKNLAAEIKSLEQQEANVPLYLKRPSSTLQHREDSGHGLTRSSNF